MYIIYLTSGPLYQAVLPGADFTSPAALARVQESVIEFIVHGMLVDPKLEKQP